MKDKALEQSRALWNRSGLDLQSDEMLAQLLDRGDIGDWRKLYSMAKTDNHLRIRIKRIVTSLPVSLPHFWLAALATLGESIDWHAAVPDYFESSSV
ncbi:MAG: hypothetical protein HY646_16760 [Acidobacteria bacterium]|nr:hypothetical protein [Acidobacteriota bacterium]